MTKTVYAAKIINGNSFEVILKKGTWTEDIRLDGFLAGTEDHLINELMVVANGKTIGTEAPKPVDVTDNNFKGNRASMYKKGATYDIAEGMGFGCYLSEAVAVAIIEMIETVKAEMDVEIDEATKALESKIEEKKAATEKATEKATNVNYNNHCNAINKAMRI